MKEYGYVRVSTKEQNELRQVVALQEQGLPLEDIFIDKQSGTDFKRPGWKRLLRKLHSGDVVYVKSIDRLGRNYKEIQEQWKVLTQKKKVNIVILDMPLLDTRNERDLMGTVISDIVLQLLSYVAETERENIKQRQAEGIRVAKEKGIRFGRPKKVSKKEFLKCYRKVIKGELTINEAVEVLHISRSTFYRYIKIYFIGE